MDHGYGNHNPQHDGRPGEAASYYGGMPETQHGSDGPGGYGQQHREGYGRNSSYPGDGQGFEGDGERGLMGAAAGGAAGAFAGHQAGHGVLGALGGAFAGHKLEDFAKDRRESKKEEEQRKHQMHSPPPPPPAYNSGEHRQHEPHGNQQSQDSHSQSRSMGGGGLAGNFSASSHDVHLEGNLILRATCRRPGGADEHSSIDLNRVLGNQDGHFHWVSGSGTTNYQVKQGDTLRDIARQYHCGFGDIAKINHLDNPDLIYPGQNLQVPRHEGGNFGASARDVHLVDGGRVLEAELKNVRGDWHRSRVDLNERISNNNGHLCLV
ncbi:CVNH domain-containing protein [Pseudomassariella vexata]|uniref:CVNH domain-domain-containing protein n=1 Tax=Pseudomassariella vexata TaxID=1141098 RepID=A0A1Y2DZF9_9PEZI|nr:CVNH domain-containing protein [Pseudomassariella vexata]ORY64486.1 CVNH domain-domain-containing protein [Pseudomassariella vexata]